MMQEICKIIGQRIRNHRNRLGLSQEQLAEKSGLHNTYIGQIERGEKNATLETLTKIIAGLEISFGELFENLDASEKESIASKCYQLVDSLNEKEQPIMYEMMKAVVEFRKME